MPQNEMSNREQQAATVNVPARPPRIRVRHQVWAKAGIFLTGIWP